VRSIMQVCSQSSNKTLFNFDLAQLPRSYPIIQDCNPPITPSGSTYAAYIPTFCFSFVNAGSLLFVFKIIVQQCPLFVFQLIVQQYW
jgi:hypothetical protein